MSVQEMMGLYPTEKTVEEVSTRTTQLVSISSSNTLRHLTQVLQAFVNAPDVRWKIEGNQIIIFIDWELAGVVAS